MMKESMQSNWEFEDFPCKPVKTKLNPRERDVLSVAVDLLMKGSPAYRIVKYCVEEKKMTNQQITNLCEKMYKHADLTNLARDISLIKWEYFNGKGDLNQLFGKCLKRFLESENE